jgi:phenylpropionate dioxygenase-like ring-hydroxylating dioxygenase large terminal subunit
MFVNSAWYAAGFSDEIGAGLLGRVICGEPVVLYRSGDGTPVVLEDLCCHRMLPLSKGRREGDAVVCGYHGMTFDPSGACIRVPGGGRVSPAYRVRSYPAVERHGFVWLWMGDAERADPAEIPDLPWADDPAWAGHSGMMIVGCDYRMVIDNLLDLSHEASVHASTIGNAAVEETPVEVEQQGRSVVVSRWMIDHEPAPLWRERIGPVGSCDRWQLINFVYPSNVVIDAGVAPTGTGAPAGDRSRGVNHMLMNVITPQTVDSTLYFWRSVRNYDIADTAKTAAARAAASRIFAEDKAVLEAQHAAISRFPGRPMVNLPLDGPSVRVRRIIDAGGA